ncbi:MAG: 2-methylcitrate dehydratase [Rhodospirillaceae bacterium]|nr:2-methylcitrate dehydratase [Rhodospirillaceae bacterium]
MAISDDRPDPELGAIAEYVTDTQITSDLAFEMAHLALFDFLGCALKALDETGCREAIKPIVPEAVIPNGARVPGTSYEFDPATAAFAIGTMGRWLDFNDSWFGKGGGHPSDMWGAILGVGDYLARRGEKLAMGTLLELGIKAYEIMGLHLSENEFGPYDYTAPLKAATAAVTCRLMGGGKAEIVNALSQGWADGQPLRIYRHPYTTPRKNWGSPDAAARGVWHAFRAVAGEDGFPKVLSVSDVGLIDAEQKGVPFSYSKPYGSHVMENILFKVYPAQFRAQTAMEAVIALHEEVSARLDEVERIDVYTHERALRTVDKRGPLTSASERDHCMQYIVAVGLIHGYLEYSHYHDETAADPRVDALREKIELHERPAYSSGFADPEIRTDASALQVFFVDGTKTEEAEVLYPLGDRRRREVAGPVLAEKFRRNLAGRWTGSNEERILSLFDDPEKFKALDVNEFMGALVV